MVRVNLPLAAILPVLIALLSPVAAQGLKTAPAPPLVVDGGNTTPPTGTRRPGTPGPANTDCVGRKPDQNCQPDDVGRPGNETRPGGGGPAGGRGIYLPPLLADLPDLGGANTPGDDPGPRPPRVDDAGNSGGAVPPRLVAPLVSPTPPSSTGPRPKPTLPPRPQTASPQPPQPVVAPVPKGPRVRPRAISGAFVPGEVLAVVNGDRTLVDSIAAANALTVLSVRTSALLGASIVRYSIPDDRSVGLVLTQIEADGRAGQPEPNHVFGLQQSDALPQYAFERIALKVTGKAGKNIGVAVIDSAVEADHPALAGAIAATHDALPDRPVVDRQHGTSIVGLIAGRGPVRGTAPGAVIYHSRAFEGGQSTMDAILRSLDWAVGENVRIINMSFAGPRNRLMGLAADAARQRGIVLVAAAGNEGPGAPRAYPAAFDSVLAVTATDTADRLMGQANRGSYVFVAAPGVEVAAPVPGGIGFVTGTSMAAAILSGGIAGLISDDPSRTPRWIEDALAGTAVDLGAPGRDRDFGFGLANFAAASRFATR